MSLASNIVVLRSTLLQASKAGRQVKLAIYAYNSRQEQYSLARIRHLARQAATFGEIARAEIGYTFENLNHRPDFQYRSKPDRLPPQPGDTLYPIA